MCTALSSITPLSVTWVNPAFRMAERLMPKSGSDADNPRKFGPDALQSLGRIRSMLLANGNRIQTCKRLPGAELQGHSQAMHVLFHLPEGLCIAKFTHIADLLGIGCALGFGSLQCQACGSLRDGVMRAFGKSNVIGAVTWRDHSERHSDICFAHQERNGDAQFIGRFAQQRQSRGAKMLVA